MSRSRPPVGPADGRALESLSGRVVRAGLWVLGARVGARLLAAVRVLVLARLLTPHDFGLVALALLPLSAFASLGVSSTRTALVHRQQRSRTLLDTAWTLGLVRRSLAAALLALGAAAAWARALHRSGASVRAIELSGNDMLLELRDGRRAAAELGGARHVSRFMVTLPVRRPVRRTILVTGDMLPPDEFRRLRLWALWGKIPAGVAPKQLPARS